MSDCNGVLLAADARLAMSLAPGAEQACMTGEAAVHRCKRFQLRNKRVRQEGKVLARQSEDRAGRQQRAQLPVAREFAWVGTRLVRGARTLSGMSGWAAWIRHMPADRATITV